MNTSTLAIVGAVAAVVVIGGGTALAARNAEPGDMLYGLRASLYNDVSADADVEANLKSAADLYAEAESLERSGRLTASERARLTAQYQVHVNAVLDRIARLEADGDAEAAAEIRTSLRSSLREYNDIFGSVSIDGQSSSSSADTTTSEDSDDDSSEDSDSSVAPASQGAASSIFVQPSSSVTSA